MTAPARVRPMSKSPAAPAGRIATALAGIALLLCGQAAQAQSWTEPRYDPPVGSRWQIDTRIDTEDMGAVPRRQHADARAVLTIEQKIPDGYRVSYVSRDFNMTGTAPQTAAIAAALGATKDVVVRARIDEAGKPVALENLDEMRTVLRQVIARITETVADKPKVAALIKQMMERPLKFEGPAAARAYLEELPRLAAAQNTGLMPGEVRRGVEATPSPFGGAPIKVTRTTRLAAWDNTAGTARIVTTRAVDPEALKDFTLAVMRKLGFSADKPMPPKLAEAMRKITIAIDSTITIDVNDGMARRLEEQETTRVEVFGNSFTKRKTKLVTVSRLP